MPNPYSPSKAIQDPFTLGAPMAARAAASSLVMPAITLPKIPARVTTPKPTGAKPTGTKPTPTRPTVEPTRPVGGGRQPSRNPFNPIPLPLVPGDQDRYVSPDYNFGGGGAGGSWDQEMPQAPTQGVRPPVVDMPEPVQARTPAKKSQFRYEEGESPEPTGSMYTIQAGDTLSALARRFGTTVQELARLNNIQNVNLIRRGAQLKLPEMQQGGIYIDPAKRGTFKAQATRMGMGVQEAASKILSNKEDYSPAMVKKANFARNAASWKKEDGGMIEYGMGGELPEYQAGGPKLSATDEQIVQMLVNQGMSRQQAVATLSQPPSVSLPVPEPLTGSGALGVVGGVGAAGAKAATTAASRLGKMFEKQAAQELQRRGVSSGTAAKVLELNKSTNFGMNVPARVPRPATRAYPSSQPSTFTGVDLGLGMAGAVATGVGVSNARRAAANPPQATMTSDMAGFLERQGVPGYRNPTPGMMASESVRPSAIAPSMGQPGAQQVPRAASTPQSPATTVRPSRPPSASIQGDEYVIQRGDTLSQIARRAGVPMETLAGLNNIQNVNMIRAGSTLRLRPQQTMQAPAPEPIAQRPPVQALDRIDLINQFDGPVPSGLPAPSVMPSGLLKRLEADLPQARENVSRAMAQEPTKKRRFSNRRTR